jgi:O-antigen/teichoic acid export membrane protein
VFAVAVMFGTWMSIATALGASFVIEVIAGHRGHGAAPVLRIQAIVFLVSFVSTSSALGLVALARYRELLIASAATLVLNIALGLALVPSLGAEGGAIADVVAEAAAAVALTTLLVRAVPEHRIGVSFLPALALATAASAIAVPLPIGSFGRAAVATVLFFAVLLRAGVLPAEVTDAARRLPLVRARA